MPSVCSRTSKAVQCQLAQNKKIRDAREGVSTFVVVVRHLEASSSESALDVEALVGFAAVEDCLVAADVLSDIVQGLDHAQAELLALLVLGDGDIFDVADTTKAVNAVDCWRLACNAHRILKIVRH